jgi:hypothetical protein
MVTHLGGLAVIALSLAVLMACACFRAGGYARTRRLFLPPSDRDLTKGVAA